jgi:lipopolysaccharide/colanic/teichoic acid biosynthesis glycosyltransferase
MTKTLPILTFTKTKELVLLNMPCEAHDLTSPLDEYEVQSYSGSSANIFLSHLIAKPNAANLPYAIVCDYKSLADNDFAVLRAIKNNLLTAAIPIIAIAGKNELVDKRKALQMGIDDCYQKPVECYNIMERLVFLSRHKKQLNDASSDQNEQLKIQISPWKRIVDVLLASVIILVLSPVFLLTALLIALESRGPIIYRSKRSGTGYQVFDFFKFRSMYADADKRLAEMQALNQYKDEGAQFVKFKNDPRITRVGKIIRKTSIDELPQLFNVLKGDMSLVGNRPLPLYEANQLTKEDWAYRFIAPAGMTGLWQVTKRGGNDMSAEERINLDVTYAQNHSFWFDMKLLLKTPFAVIQKENV